MSDVKENARPDSLRPTAVSAACIAGLIGGVPLVLAQRRVSVSEFPDYGDLWRWAMTLHLDEHLTAKELFSETNIIGHNHVLTIWLSSLATDRLNYSLLWWLGFVGVVLSIGSLAFFVARSVTGVLSAPLAMMVAVVTGLLSFRFDQRQVYFNSLLVFEQLYYFIALAALLLGARIQAKQLLGSAVSTVGYAAIGLALLFGEAPSALSLIVLVGMAVLALPFSGQWRHLGSLLTVALVGLAVKWGLRAFVGGRGDSNGPSSAVSFLDPRAVPDWLRLTGASWRSFVDDRSQPAPDMLYLVLGLAIVALLVVAFVGTAYVLHRRVIEKGTLELALAGIMLMSFAVLAAMFIVDARGLPGRYDVGRFVRSTQFAIAGVALVGLAVWMHSVRLFVAWRCAVFALAALVLLMRVPAANTVLDEAVFLRNNRVAEVAQLCAAEADFEWDKIWFNASPQRGAEFGESELFARWQQDRCPPPA